MPQDTKNNTKINKDAIVNNYLQTLIPSDAGISSFNSVQSAMAQPAMQRSINLAGSFAGDISPFENPFKNVIGPTGTELTEFGKLSLRFRQALQEAWPEGLPDEISKSIREHARYLVEYKPKDVSKDLINKATDYVNYLNNRENLRNLGLPAPSIAFWQPKVANDILGKILPFIKPE